MKRIISGADHRIVDDYKISKRDYYQIFTSILMVILGVVILTRSFVGNITIMPLLVGGGFLAVGCYRLNFVIKYLKIKRKKQPWEHT